MKYKSIEKNKKKDKKDKNNIKYKLRENFKKDAQNIRENFIFWSNR